MKWESSGVDSLVEESVYSDFRPGFFSIDGSGEDLVGDSLPIAVAEHLVDVLTTKEPEEKNEDDELLQRLHVTPPAARRTCNSSRLTLIANRRLSEASSENRKAEVGAYLFILDLLNWHV